MIGQQSAHLGDGGGNERFLDRIGVDAAVDLGEGALEIPFQRWRRVPSSRVKLLMARRVFEAVKTSGVTISSSRRANSAFVRRTRLRASNFLRKLASSVARLVMSGRYSYLSFWRVPIKPYSMWFSRTTELGEAGSS
jgi:hypothetical protein